MFFDCYFILFECSRLFENPFLSIHSVVSWFIRPVSTDTGDARQKSQSLLKFHEFMEHLCNLVGQNKGHNHSLLLRKACLSLLKANNLNNNNGVSKKIVSWLGQLINDKAQNTQAARVQSFNSTKRKWQSHEDALASIAAATASLR
jgi:hypothetical protein